MNDLAKTYVYHQLYSPEGKVVSAKEAKSLYEQGWVDTPAKYGKGLRGKWYSLIIELKKSVKELLSFLKREWKWIAGFFISLAGLFLAYLKL